jgi:hypothetical protein
VRTSSKNRVSRLRTRHRCAKKPKSTIRCLKRSR